MNDHNRRNERLLSNEEIARLERKARTLRNRRNRKGPAIVPDRLARTSAFAPRKKDLDESASFSRTYIIPGYSIIEIKGRQLGAQHRDALYALFRLKRTTIEIPDENYKRGRLMSPIRRLCETRTTWRELLQICAVSSHVNNLLTLMTVFEQIMQVTLIVHEARTPEDFEKMKARRARGLIGGAGTASSLITRLDWDGPKLDSEVVVQFGPDMLRMVERAHLVSLNADVHFRIASDNGRAVWPWIDSQPNHTWIGEERIAQLTDRDFATMATNSQKLGQFRKECRQALNDMVKAGGLISWDTQIIGEGSRKRRRYHYVHALPRQCELTKEQPIATSEGR